MAVISRNAAYVTDINTNKILWRQYCTDSEVLGGHWAVIGDRCSDKGLLLNIS